MASQFDGVIVGTGTGEDEGEGEGEGVLTKGPVAKAHWAGLSIMLTTLALASTATAQKAPAGSKPTIKASSAAMAAKTPGWEFARWGMTPAQVRAASHGVVIGTVAGVDSLTGDYAMGPFKFNVDIDYQPRPDDPGNSAADNLILGGVVLSLEARSGSCPALAAYLKTIYGKPDRTTTQGPLNLDWRKKAIGDDITYFSWPDKSCGVRYGPYGSS
jgi:hypothetical protein